jgi:nicotinamide-nucleotide amidase
MQLEIITIGEELLLGFTIDTNAAHLARALAPIGARVVRRATVGDDASAIAAAVAEALHRTGAVITTGGLGPTSDDATKPAIARLFGREMKLDDAILRGIEDRFRQFGFRGAMPSGNRQQALIPDGAEVLPNAHGTAPGIWLEDARGRWVAMLPGVPREMRGMLRDELLPRLESRTTERSTVVLSRTLRTTGIGESALAEKLGNLSREVDGLPLAYLPGWEGADLRLTVSGQSAAAATRMLDGATAQIRQVVGEYVYGEGDDDLAGVVLERCRRGELTIAVAESCTGGLLGVRLTEVPGSSDVFLGGVVAYADTAKTELAGVPAALISEHGAVSGEVAQALALGIRQRLGAAIGVGITGIAGPGGATGDKPVGLVWTSVVAGDSERSFSRNYVGDRREIRQRAAQGALEAVRRLVDALDHPGTDSAS